MKELTAEDIKAMIAEGENVNVEFKECGKTLPKDFWPTYSAFANTHGGWIILGVQEHTDRLLPDRFEIVGLNDPAKVLNELGSQLDNPQKVSRNILSSNDTYLLKVDGKPLLVVHVPEADYRHKPVYLHGNKVTHSYKRTLEGDSHLTDEELAMMLRDAFTGDNDMTLMEPYDMRHVDAETLRKYRTAFNILNNGHPFADSDDKQFLIQMGAYVIDEATGKEGLTMAGVLMFGKGLVIRNLFPNFRMDYIDLSGIPVGSGLKWNERLTYDGRWENNLYNFVTFVMQKITFGLPNPGRVKGMVRNDDTPVFMALRESVTNSVIHSDFKIEGILRIEKHDDYIELRNPGLLKLSRDKIYRGKHSRSRNPKIQDMLRMIGFGDNIGSGFPLILSAWRDEAWIQPDLTDDQEVHEVKLTLRMSTLYGADVMEQINALYGEAFAKLSPDEKECIVLIISDKCQTNSELQLSTGKNGWEINRILGALKRKGFILSHPNGRWTTYEANHEFVATAGDKPSPAPVSQTTVEEATRLPITSVEEIRENAYLREHLTPKQIEILEAFVSSPTASIKEIATMLGIKDTWLRSQKEIMQKYVDIRKPGSTRFGRWGVSIDINVR